MGRVQTELSELRRVIYQQHDAALAWGKPVTVWANALSSCAVLVSLLCSIPRATDLFGC